VSESPQPGDYGVQRGNSLAAWAIKVATRSKFSHAFVVVRDGNVVEARGSGAVCRPLGVRDAIYSSDAIQLSPFDRNNIVNNAMGFTTRHIARRTWLGRRYVTVGVPYGWLDIVSIGLLQYGIKPKCVRDRVQRLDQLICSQLVDAAFSGSPTRTAVDAVLLATHGVRGVHLFADNRLPMDVTPGDLAKRAGWR
jgi:hypothetical protein